MLDLVGNPEGRLYPCFVLGIIEVSHIIVSGVDSQTAPEPYNETGRSQCLSFSCYPMGSQVNICHQHDRHMYQLGFEPATDLSTLPDTP